jgi:ferric-dicitrate binding protein FerR (iron transport regulator)
LGHANFNVVHNNSKFLVQTKDSIEVEVLGTNFNVMAYPEQEIVQTVLAEGKVSFGVQGKQKVTLKPMYKAEFKLGEIKVQEVDLFEYFAWLEGILVFKDRSFQEILRTLEKYYDVEIYCENQQLLRKKFDATFDVETIEHVLQSFQENFQFEYELNKNQILIK